MDGMTYQPALPGIRIPDRSPLNMPSTPARAVLQAAAVQFRVMAAGTLRRTGQKDMANTALADAMEEAASGNEEAAFQALIEAAMYRRIGA